MFSMRCLSRCWAVWLLLIAATRFRALCCSTWTADIFSLRSPSRCCSTWLRLIFTTSLRAFSFSFAKAFATGHAEYIWPISLQYEQGLFGHFGIVCSILPHSVQLFLFLPGFVKSKPTILISIMWNMIVNSDVRFKVGIIKQNS